MASSLSNGERRWCSARKSGMTVLGKVPKPVNLPSQRLENHGLDPNVEIVPKGTLTWGSRPASTIQNAWGSSPQSSPNTDGGSSSCLDRRPSSGGSGRPSTADSDKTFEPVNSAWTLNSRPSSASGIVASNQSSIMTRPRSAETRPGSSQLSRFANSGPENLVPRGPSVIESLGHGSTEINDFTLTSGDFPTLGSEKNSEINGQTVNDNYEGRPSSAQDSRKTQKEQIEVSPKGSDAVNVTSEKEMANNRKIDTPHAGVGASPNIDNWHRDSQSSYSHSDMNISHQHINTWHGSPPVHNRPDGMWYRGVPPAGPYRPMGSHGNYPMEGFPYYPSQPPARPPNSQSDPRAGAILGGYPHKNGESFHSPMSSDSRMFAPPPVFPVRPGIYQGQIPYDGYYGPHPRMETPRETAVSNNFNNYQNQNTAKETDYVHARSSSFAGLGDHLEPTHHHKPHGDQYRPLFKQHVRCVVNATTNHNRKHISAGCNIPDVGKVKQTEAIMKNGDKEEKNTKDELEVVGDYFGATVNDLEGKVVNDNRVKIGGTVDYSNKKNAALEGKTQAISNNTQITNGFTERSISAKRNSTRGNTAKTVEVNDIAGSKKYNAVSFGDVSISTEKSYDESENQSLRDDSIFQNKTSVVKKSSKAGIQFSNPQIMRTSNNALNGSLSSDSADYKFQRAELKQMAKERAKQLQKEEEERINEQRSKAQAKLEELNIRTAGESSDRNSILVPQPNDALHTRPGHVPDRVLKPDAFISEESLLPPLASEVELFQKNVSPKVRHDGLIEPGLLSFEKKIEHGSSKHEQKTNTILVSGPSTNRSEIFNTEKSKKIQDSGGNKLAINQERSSLNSEVAAHTSLSSDHPTELSSHQIISHGIVSKQRQMGRKRQQNVQQEENPGGLSFSPVDRVESEVIHKSGSQSLLVVNDSKDAGDMLVQNKKKNNRDILSKNIKGKIPPASPLPIQSVAGISENTLESVQTGSVAAQVSQGDSTKSNSPTKSFGQNMFMVGDNHGNPNNQWKPHPPRKTTRNAQYRPVDKIHGTEVVWAPVKSFAKSESSVLPSNSTIEANIHSTVENGNVMLSNMKSKRAEIERYVPKFGKKISGQTSDQNQAPSVEATSNSEIGSSLGNVEVRSSVVKESELMATKKNLDHGRSSKHGKNQTSWRQCNSHEIAISDVAESFDANQTSGLDAIISQTFSSGDFEKRTHRVKSQTHKAHKSVGTNHHVISDGKNFVTESLESGTQISLGSNVDFDGKRSLKDENRNFGEHTRPQWKPKSQARSSHNSSVSGQRVVSQFQIGKEQSQLQVTINHQVGDKNNAAQESVIPEGRSTDHRETTRRQKKFNTGSLKEKNDPPNKNVLKTGDLIQSEIQTDWTDSGRVRQGQQSQHRGNFNREQENGRPSGQISGDKSKHASRYQYQKSGSQYKTTSDSGDQLNIEWNEEANDGFHKRGQFYRGRGQNQMRRGRHYHAQNSGPSRAAGYTHDNRE